MNATIDTDYAEIKKFSRYAIAAIWLTGLFAVLVFVVFYLFTAEDADTRNKSGFNAMTGLNQLPDKVLFSDKTTLVNIGLKIQETADLAEVKSSGSIAIRKIKYDQPLKEGKKQQKVKPDFYVDFIPK